MCNVRKANRGSLRFGLAPRGRMGGWRRACSTQAAAGSSRSHTTSSEPGSVTPNGVRWAMRDVGGSRREARRDGSEVTRPSIAPTRTRMNSAAIRRRLLSGGAVRAGALCTEPIGYPPLAAAWRDRAHAAIGDGPARYCWHMTRFRLHSRASWVHS